jgi:heat shock protein HslJ
MKTLSRLILLILVASLGLAACDEAKREARPSNLIGSAWQVVAINGRAPVARSEPTMIFAAAEVKGSAGCNSYGGRYSYDQSTGSIAFAEFSMTAMACQDGARNDYESLFTTSIGKVSAASMDPDGRLVLSGPATEIVLTVMAQ